MFANVLDSLLTFTLSWICQKMTGSVLPGSDARAPGSTMTGLDPFGYRSDQVATLHEMCHSTSGDNA